MTWAKILIADDHMLMAEGLSKLLENQYECVGIVTNPSRLVREVDNLQPDAILLDISMPQVSGLEAARQIHKRHPETKIIFVTMRGEPEYVAEAFETGAMGYVLKNSAGVELLKGIKEVLRGRKFISAELSSQLESIEPVKGAGRPFNKVLTLRQRQVLQLLCEGNSAKVIGYMLSISTKTVEFHKTAMMKVVGAQNTAELIRFAVESGVYKSLPAGSEAWRSYSGSVADDQPVLAYRASG